MSIILNGTTGITTPDIESAAGLDTSDINDNAVTAAKLHTTAVTDKLGYTPVNKAGDSMTGALYTPSIRMTNYTMKTINVYSNGASTGVNRIAYLGRHYWGSGTVYLTVMHGYYTNFKRSVYAINGDSKVNDGVNGFSIETEYNGGVVNAPYIGTYTTFPDSGGSTPDQYAEILIAVPAYQKYVILFECANISVYDQTTPPLHTNAISIFDQGVII